MHLIAQIGAVITMNLRSLAQRRGSSLVIIIGSAGVVAVLVALLAMSVGMSKTLQGTGRDDRAIVLRKGSVSESGSALSRAAVQIIVDAPGIRHDAEGRPLASAEPLRLLKLFKRDDGSEVTAVLRGLGGAARAVRPEIKIIEGRWFRPAINELIVGKSAAAQYRGMEVGSRVATRTASWVVVGTFESNGDAHESELLADADTVMSSDNASTYAGVTVLLDQPGSLRNLADSLTTNPALRVDVTREREYFSRQSKTVSRLLSVLLYVVGSIMGVGAIFGALNTMYSAVSTRTIEIATLRAIGFGSTPIVVSVLTEAMLLAGAGGAIGACAAWLFFNGRTVSTTQGTAYAQLIFEIAVNRNLALAGIAASIVIGLVGGLFPAIRAGRLPIATALRAV
ncbi:MAG TPA: ABC transporter permease [Steroidobacteraceae bacterium]|nr:ABC transporter permease [Steroidobacteraceae bacterium]